MKNSNENLIDYKDTIRDAVLKDSGFIRLVLSSKKNDMIPWIKVAVRPVEIKGRRKHQFSYYDTKKVIVKNYFGDELVAMLDELLAIPFNQITLMTTSSDTNIRITDKGKVLTSTSKPSCNEEPQDLSHDRKKAFPIPDGVPDELLYTLGVMNREGHVRPGMQGKFHQVNEFLLILDRSISEFTSPEQPIHVVDCGSGNAYLTFAAYYYLNMVRGLNVQVSGVEANEKLTQKCIELRDNLGWQGLEFWTMRIADFVPPVPPDVVLSLHACDTATDDAIAQGILWGSKLILAAPCCQHELNTQISSQIFRPIIRHGILKERLADIITDSFRAIVLRIMGYSTDVIQFVDPEHSAKNIMIRAEKKLKPGHKPSVQEYKELKDFWKVTPYIEKLLGEQIDKYLR
ncbi:SAM-dependent methyltransferase [uncultured Desulfobulbus sp.]|uniref:class I SAM-dependent methyltransferase n=1 Tax=uncultured Desulfobulbus sp. TaxID=239745 RepID=UPI0029C98C52|nr:SAM-dependent methyltransferase [uncultured Desulfobulbus sp.]